MREPYPPSISPDDDVFRHLAIVYASNHPTMHLGYPCDVMDREFQGGITNGAAWYPLTGKCISGHKQKTCFEIYELFHSISNMEELPQQWMESIIVPIYKE
jgi:hypothetical protein